jgi:hypothetical protein
LVIRNHRLPASIRHVVPAAFVGSLGLLLMTGLFWRPALAGGIVLAGTYLAAVLFASLVTAARAEWKLLPVLPLAFCCFQLGYGYGFLRGIVDFVLLQKAPATRFVQLTREQRRSPSTI